MSADVSDETRMHDQWRQKRGDASAKTLVRSLGKRGVGMGVTDGQGRKFEVCHKRVETKNRVPYTKIEIDGQGVTHAVQAVHVVSQLVPVLKIDGREVPEADLEKHHEFLLQWVISVDALDPDTNIIDTLHQQAALQAA